MNLYIGNSVNLSGVIAEQWLVVLQRKIWPSALLDASYMTILLTRYCWTADTWFLIGLRKNMSTEIPEIIKQGFKLKHWQLDLGNPLHQLFCRFHHFGLAIWYSRSSLLAMLEPGLWLVKSQKARWQPSQICLTQVAFYGQGLAQNCKR